MSLRIGFRIVLLLAVLTGCMSNNETDATEENAPSSHESIPVHADENDVLTILSLPDRWDAAVDDVMENSDSYLGRFEVRRWEQTLYVDKFWGEFNKENQVSLTGYARKEDGRMERMLISGKQTDFDEENLRHLQPYYEVLIAVTNPELSDQERSNIMRELSLDGDVAALAERSNIDGQNTVTVNDIRYDVAIIASGEGSTFALVATIDQHCAGNRVLSPCRSNRVTEE